MRKTELLVPAGSLDVLKTAVIFGADAVYLGGEAFGLRAKAKNFTNEEIKEGIKESTSPDHQSSNVATSQSPPAPGPSFQPLSGSQGNSASFG